MDQLLIAAQRIRIVRWNLAVCALTLAACLASAFFYQAVSKAAGDQADASGVIYISGKGSVRLARGEQMDCIVIQAYKKRRNYNYRLMCSHPGSRPTPTEYPYPLYPFPPAPTADRTPPPYPAETEAPTAPVVTVVVTVQVTASP